MRSALALVLPSHKPCRKQPRDAFLVKGCHLNRVCCRSWAVAAPVGHSTVNPEQLAGLGEETWVLHCWSGTIKAGCHHFHEQSMTPAVGGRDHSRRARERTWVPHWVHCCPGAAAPTVLSRPPTRRRRLAAFSALALLRRAPRRLPPHALPSAHAHHGVMPALNVESDCGWAPQTP